MGRPNRIVLRIEEFFEDISSASVWNDVSVASLNPVKECSMNQELNIRRQEVIPEFPRTMEEQREAQALRGDTLADEKLRVEHERRMNGWKGK